MNIIKKMREKMKYLRAGILCTTFSALTSAEELTGVWQLVKGEYVNAEGQLVDYAQLDLHSIKIISATHFSFNSMQGNKFYASGSGTYRFSDGHYRETLQFNSFGESPGKIYEFSSKLEDGFWYNSRWSQGQRVEYEVWKKIE